MAWKIQFSLYSCQIWAKERPLWRSQWAVSHHKSLSIIFSNKEREKKKLLWLGHTKSHHIFSSLSPTVILHLYLFFRSWIYFPSAGCWICDNAENRVNQNRSGEKRWERTAVEEENRHPLLSPLLWDWQSVEPLTIEALITVRGTEVKWERRKRERDEAKWDSLKHYTF